MTLRLSLITLVLLFDDILSAQRPNILYTMSDDHAAHAISLYGGKLAEVAPTPNLERIERERAARIKQK